MDQQEELRSLYSVICPRCQSVSQAGDIACPYCGADRHGAVLTRADEPLVSPERIAKAVMPSFEAIGDAHNVAALPPVGPTATTRDRAAVLAVILCIMVGGYGLVRAFSQYGVHGSRDDGVSATGVVWPVASVKHAPRANDSDAAQAFQRDRTSSITRDGSQANQGSPQPVAFNVPAPWGASSCTVDGAAAFGIGLFWCGSRSTQGVPRAMDAVKSAQVSEGDRSAQALRSIKTGRDTSRIYTSAKDKRSSTQHAGRYVASSKPHACSHRKGDVCAGKDRPRKTQQRTLARNHALSSDVKTGSVEYSRDPVIVPSMTKPAMTSAGSWTPSPDSPAVTGKAQSSASAQGAHAGAPNRGRGEAH